MTSTAETLNSNAPRNWRRFGRGMPIMGLAAMALGFLAFMTGCQTPDTATRVDQIRSQAETNKQPEILTVREGDVLKISFPGTPNLDTMQTVRRDGRITMSIVGEVMAAGLTPAELEKELLKLYSSQLISKEVSVTVVSSSFAVYVSGAVSRPGKIMSDRPISALEAIMEAGGFDNAKADMRAVVVIRREEGQTKNYTLNLKLVLEGKQSEQFYLKPFDIVYVPERFSWF
jgi:polysaccharide export outer membrane protein